MNEAYLRLGLQCGRCGFEMLQKTSNVFDDAEVQCTNRSCQEYGVKYLYERKRVALRKLDGTGPRDA